MRFRPANSVRCPYLMAGYLAGMLLGRQCSSWVSADALMYERAFDLSTGLRTVLTSALSEMPLNARSLDGPISLVGIVMARAFC